MLKIFPKNAQIKPTFGFKLFFATLALVFTAFLAGDALERILYSLMNPPSGDQVAIENAARQATMIVLCGLATATIRIIAGPFPQGVIRFCAIVGFAFLMTVALINIGIGLGAHYVPASAVICSVGLIACTLADDVYVITAKRKAARRGHEEKSAAQEPFEAIQ